METLKQYLDRQSISEGSPVGNTMAKVAEKYPGISFDSARAKANHFLEVAAKKRKYVTPRVLSEAEIAKAAVRLKTAFRKTKAAA
jgi:hypothetical protein